jgi:hypothetical protein
MTAIVLLYQFNQKCLPTESKNCHSRRKNFHSRLAVMTAAAG